MPHDKYGRKIDLGDVIITTPYNQGKGPQRQYAGVVVEMEEMQTCTGQVVYQKAFTGNVTDYFGADESILILKADGNTPELVNMEEYCAECGTKEREKIEVLVEKLKKDL